MAPEATADADPAPEAALKAQAEPAGDPAPAGGEGGEGGAAAAAAETGGRVKLYVLNAERSWDDKGTGYVLAELHQESSEERLSLVVRSESEAESFLLQSTVLPDTAYQKQQETLIVWSEGENCDLALSFQEKSACDTIWEKICQVQGKDPSVEVTQDVSYEEASDENELDTSGAGLGSGGSGPGLSLPPVEVGRLGELLDLILTSHNSPMKRESLALALESGKYLGSLCEVFRMVEDLEDLHSLHLLFQIAKNIFHLNKNALFDILFSEELLQSVIGMLEYDPGPSPPRVYHLRNRHRKFLFETAQFKEVLPMDNAELKAKIHQTFRVQYIQDVILPAPSIFEENMLSSLTSFVFFNKVEIVSIIQEDSALLRRLFSQLQDPETGTEKRRDLAAFLKEYCSFSQTLQQPARDGFFKAMVGKVQNAARQRLGLRRLSTGPESPSEEAAEAEVAAASDPESRLTRSCIGALRDLAGDDDDAEALHLKGTSLMERIEFTRELMRKDRSRQSQLRHAQQKAQLHRQETLSGEKILLAMSVCLECGDGGTRASATEVLAMLVDYSPALLREHVMEQVRGNAADSDLLLNVLIRQLLADPDPELSSAMQLANILRIVVDPENMVQGAGPRAEKSEFLSLFYRRCMEGLVRPLVENTALRARRPIHDDYHRAHKLSLVLEILGFCMEHHTFNIRQFVVNKHILGRVAVLLGSRHAFLALAGLRFIRKVIQIKDEFYNRHIVKHDVFGAITAAFLANGPKYNLLNSAILETFEFIRQEDIRSLWLHVAERYLPQLQDVDYVKTFDNLKIRYEQHLDRQRNVNGTPSPQRTRSYSSSRSGDAPTPPLGPAGWGRRDDDEEAYFEQDDEWDDGHDPSPSKGPSASPSDAAATEPTASPPSTPPKDKENLQPSPFQRQGSFNGTPRPGSGGRSLSPMEVGGGDEDGFLPHRPKAQDDDEAGVFGGKAGPSALAHGPARISIKPIGAALAAGEDGEEEKSADLPSLVDYDYGDSDSDPEDASSPAKSKASSPGSAKVSSSTVPLPPTAKATSLVRTPPKGGPEEPSSSSSPKEPQRRQGGAEGGPPESGQEAEAEARSNTPPPDPEGPRDWEAPRPSTPPCLLPEEAAAPASAASAASSSGAVKRKSLDSPSSAPDDEAPDPEQPTPPKKAKSVA